MTSFNFTGAGQNIGHVLSRACGQAQLLEPTYAKIFYSFLAQRAGATGLVDVDGQLLDSSQMAEQVATYSGGSSARRERPYQVVDGVAILPVSGTLLHKFGYTKPRSGCTGYDGLIARMNDAVYDIEVTAILLDIDSPGGELAGCFDATDTIRKFRDIKPIYGVCHDTMCSAAMALGSACTERWITQTGRAGSVGVLIAHTDIADKLASEGVKITLIHSGKHKVDGNPYEHLSEEVLNNIKASLDQSRAKFAQIVADNIGMTSAAVLDTEARVYTGDDAVNVGFANQIVNGNEALPLLIDVIKTKTKTGVYMSENNGGEPVITAADITKAHAEGVAVGEKQARERCAGILQSAQAEGREQSAQTLAFDTDLGLESALSLLETFPKQDGEQGQGQNAGDNMGDGLSKAMGGTEQPNLKIDGDGDDGEQLSGHQVLMNSYGRVAGGNGVE